VTFVFDAILDPLVIAPINLGNEFASDAIGKMLLVGIGWGYLDSRMSTKIRSA
jgi:hypothetical protein